MKNNDSNKNSEDSKTSSFDSESLLTNSDGIESTFAKKSKNKPLPKNKVNDSTTINSDELKKVIDNLAKEALKKDKKPIVKSISLMADRYKKAYTIVYNKKEQWRKEEIDKARNDGKMSRWDLDFVQQIICLAESNETLVVMIT